MKAPIVGVPFVLAVCTFYAFTSASSGLGYANGTNALTVLTVRTLAVAIALAVWLRLTGVSLALEPRLRNRALLLGVVMGFSTFGLNTAFEHTAVPLAVLIFYINPAVTTLFAWLAGTERVGRRQVFAIVLAFVGVGLVMRVDAGSIDTFGVAAALVGAVLWSVLIHFTGTSFQGRDSRPVTMHMMLSGGVLGLVASLATDAIAWPVNTTGWIGFLTVPVWYFVAIVGTFAATIRLGPIKTSFYMNFEPIATIVVSALVLKQWLEPVQLAGGALIIGALFLFRAAPSK